MKDNKDYFVHKTACVDDGAIIGKGSKIWHFSHICGKVKIGDNCIFGQNTMVADDALIGNNVKVQNNVSIYGGVVLEDDVFLGPSCVLTNVSNPRSQINRKKLYEKTIIKLGATIGANSTIISGIEIGRYAFISAGSVVTKNIPDYGLVKGVPGVVSGWMSRHGHKLEFNIDNKAICPETKYIYTLKNNVVSCESLKEESALPVKHTIGLYNYEYFKEST